MNTIELLGATHTMSADSCVLSRANPLAIPQTSLPAQSYFRSKLFVITATKNPLIAAANPIFSVLERLSISQTLPAIRQVRDSLHHELLAFHNRLLSQNYTDECIVIARYLLSATIDELIGKNYLRVYGQAAEFEAFTPPTLEDDGPEHRFFDIAHYIKERTNQYLDLLELMYHCLITGFEGKYHLRADGRQSLDNLIEELHQCIQQHRVHQSKRLFEDPLPKAQTPPSVNRLLIGLLTLGALGLVLSCYVGSSLLLEHHATTILQHHILPTHVDY